MDSEATPVPLPPPPLQPDVEPEPDWRLSWWTVLYLALAGLVTSVGLLLSGPLLSQVAPFAPFTGLLHGIGRGAADSVLSGIGVILFDRRAGTRSPRGVRWALGAALGTAMSRLPPFAPMVSAFIRRGLIVVPLPVVARELVAAGLAVAASAFVGFYLGRALWPETDPWRRLPLAGLQASLAITGAYFVLSLLAALFGASGSPIAPIQWLRLLGVLLLVATASGLLTGCAFAAGVSAGEREICAQAGGRE